MNQSSVIGAALVIAYVIFVITKGELPCYMTVLGIATAAGCPQPLQPPGCSGTGSSSSTTSSTTGGGTTVNNPFCITIRPGLTIGLCGGTTGGGSGGGGGFPIPPIVIGGSGGGGGL